MQLQWVSLLLLGAVLWSSWGVVAAMVSSWKDLPPGGEETETGGEPCPGLDLSPSKQLFHKGKSAFPRFTELRLRTFGVSFVINSHLYFWKHSEIESRKIFWQRKHV